MLTKRAIQATMQSQTSIASVHSVQSIASVAVGGVLLTLDSIAKFSMHFRLRGVCTFERAISHSNNYQIKLNVFSICDFRNYIVYSIITGFIYTVLHYVGAMHDCVDAWMRVYNADSGVE